MVILYTAVPNAIVLSLVLGHALAWAASPAVAPPRNVIGVTGSGMLTAKADAASAILGVTLIRGDLSSVTAETASRISAVVDAVKGLGIDGRDVTTQAYFIEPMSTPNGATGYRVTHLLQLRVRRLERIGIVVDTATRAGANIVQSVSFAVDDPSNLRRGAREAAIRDAALKANQLAVAAGLRLGGILEIVERPTIFKALPQVPGSPISLRGDVEVTVSVEVRYGVMPLLSPLSRVFPPLF